MAARCPECGARVNIYRRVRDPAPRPGDLAACYSCLVALELGPALDWRPVWAGALILWDREELEMVRALRRRLRAAR